ncbi:MAG: family 43 glycosylhydrolase, partial [Pseudobutyrivibrio sp.]|nr:family 43 glycosylhydrolase [Pseudobutyrivibrio sp.]
VSKASGADPILSWMAIRAQEIKEENAPAIEGEILHYTFADVAAANSDKVGLNSISNGAVIPNSAATGSDFDAELVGHGAMLRTDALVLPGSASNEDNWALKSKNDAAYVKLPEAAFTDENGKMKDTLTINFWAQNQSRAGDWSTFFVGTKAKNNAGGVTPTNYLLVNTKKNSNYKAVLTHNNASTSSPWGGEDGITQGATGNVWQMYTVVVTPDTITTWLDGKVVATANHSMKMSEWIDQTGAASEFAAYIGRSEYLNDGLWSGAVKEFSAYDRVLSAEEITSLYKVVIPDENKEALVKAVSFDKSVLKETSASVKAGESYELPEKTTVKLSDNTVLDAYITWTDENGKVIDDVSMLRAGTYNLTGKVSGYFKGPFIAESADPYVTYDEENEMYYFTCSDPAYGSINAGYNKISLRASKTLEGLAEAEPVVIWDAKDSSVNKYGSQHIWAPEIHRIGGKWYVYFAGTIDSGAWSIRPRILVCDGNDPMTGKWTEHARFTDKNGGYTGFNGMSLDMTYFEANGKSYVIWADIEPKSMLKIAEVDPADPTKCISDQLIIAYPEYSWERVNEIVNEGASVLKKDGKIYVTFSASGTGPEYCVGLLTADENADLLDITSWSKRTTPILQSSDLYQQYGPGHNSFTKDENGNDIIVYHARDEKCYTDKCAYANSNSLYDPCRHANLAYVRYDESGAPVFYSTAYKELDRLDTLSLKLTVKRSEASDYSAGYLWTFFKAQGGYEKIYLGYSEDGLNWVTLNNNKPILVNDAQGSDLGVRDPHIIRSNDGKKYWIIGTDLHAEGGGAGGSGWNQLTASKNIVVWESDDLVNWSEPQIVYAGFETAGCVWAPEAIWDEATKDYLVYYSVRDAA